MFYFSPPQRQVLTPPTVDYRLVFGRFPGREFNSFGARFELRLKLKFEFGMLLQ